MSGRRRTWERRSEECAKAYEAASLYFSLGAGRTLKEVAQKCTKSVSMLRRWSMRYQWQKRARAYDEHMARIEQAARERLAKESAEQWFRREAELREKKYQLGLKLIEKAEHMLNFPLARQTVREEAGQRITTVQPAKWTMPAVARLAITGFELAQQAILNERGMEHEGNEEERWVLEDLKPPAPKS